jgi:uroporphyrinogen decarboxylase
MIIALSLLCTCYLTSAAKVFQVAFNVSPAWDWLPTVVLCVVVLGLTLWGGLVSVAWTDYASFFVTMVALPVLFAVAAVKGGGWAGLEKAFPAKYVSFNLGDLWGDPVLSTQFIIGITLLNVMMYQMAPWYGQRMFAARDERTAYRSMVLTTVLTVLVYLLSIGTAAFVRTQWPDLKDGEMALAYAVAFWCPVALKGLMLAMVFAVCQTTLSSIWNTNASMIAEDIYVGLFRPQADDREMIKASHVITIAIAAFTVIVSVFFVKQVLGVILFADVFLLVLIFATMGGFLWWDASEAGAWASTVAGIVWGCACVIPGSPLFEHWLWNLTVFGGPIMFLTGIIFSLALPGGEEEERRRVAFFEKAGAPWFGRAAFERARAALAAPVAPAAVPSLPTADPRYRGLCSPFRPDYEGLLRNLRREGTPDRVYFMELGVDGEVVNAVDERFGVSAHLDRSNPDYPILRDIAVRRFLGYDYCRSGIGGLSLPLRNNVTEDTASLKRAGGRTWRDETRGPIASWEDFEKYPWPDLSKLNTEAIEKYSRLLPDDMGLTWHGAHFCEYLVWLFGYENLGYQLYDNRPLVKAVADRIMEIEVAACRLALQFDRIRIMWHSDDIGFKTGLMFSLADMREFVVPGHRRLAQMAHEAGRLVLLHACGQRDQIMEDLIEDVKLDGIHSFEDVILPVTEAKRRYGRRLAVIGGIDVDLLCRAEPQDIRRRVCETLDVCQPGGGYALGSGNTVANYIPLDNYLTMLDEGRLYRG